MHPLLVGCRENINPIGLLLSLNIIPPAVSEIVLGRKRKISHSVHCDETVRDDGLMWVAQRRVGAGGGYGLERRLLEQDGTGVPVTQYSVQFNSPST